MPKIQTPTVGRKVWYRPAPAEVLSPTNPFGMNVYGSAPLDATVIAVWGDRIVNLLVTDIIGKQYPELSVTLVQDGDTPPPNGRYCEWMPYQKAQHAKAEEKPAIQSDPDDFPLGQACSTVDGTCEACQ